jgi:phospholipid/cholesterol/gamma-HCH transport system substrate-binding protein
MSTRANPMVIGAFVVGAVALLLVALLVWGGTGLFRTKLNYVLFFDSAVTGLNKGAPVLGRGVKVGEVTDVQMRWGTPIIAVYIILDPEALKGAAEAGPARRIEYAVREEGLRGQLRMQSFVTGVLYVALDFHPGTPIVLRGLDKRVPELPTIPTDLEVWTAKLERFAERIEKVPFEQIGQSAATVLDEVKKIVASKETHDLVPNANAAILDARTLVRRIDAQVDPMFAQLNGALTRLASALDAARQLALDVDGRVDPLATQAEATLKAAQGAIDDVRPLIADLRHLAAKLDGQADPLLTSLRGTSDTARTTMERAQVTLGNVDRTLDQGSPLGYELFQTLKEFRAAAQALRSLADYLERVPDSLVRGVRRPSRGAK